MPITGLFPQQGSTLIPMSTSQQSLADIQSAFDSVSALFRASEYADACAIGVWSDDPQNPGITAVVFQGKLYALVIPDSWKSRSPEDLTDVINAVLINAYAEWNADHDRLSRLALSQAA